MNELLTYLKDRYLNSNKSEMQDSISKQRVKNNIIDVCEKYLVNIGDEFTFEVLDKDLGYALAVIDEEPLRSRYSIIQVGENLLCASLKEIDMGEL